MPGNGGKLQGSSSPCSQLKAWDQSQPSVCRSPGCLTQTEAKRGGGGEREEVGGRRTGNLTQSKYLSLQIKGLGKMQLRLVGESGPEVKRYLDKGVTP